MKRIEIVANKTVEQDILESMRFHGVDSHYTLIPEVHGKGDEGPRRGDTVWPEKNFMLIVYCSEEHALLLKKAVQNVKEIHPREGIKLFETG